MSCYACSWRDASCLRHPVPRAAGDANKRSGLLSGKHWITLVSDLRSSLLYICFFLAVSYTSTQHLGSLVGLSFLVCISSCLSIYTSYFMFCCTIRIYSHLNDCVSFLVLKLNRELDLSLCTAYVHMSYGIAGPNREEAPRS